MLSNEVVVEESFYKAIRKACNSTQHEVIDKIFGKEKTFVPKLISFKVTSQEELDAVRGITQVNIGVPNVVYESKGVNKELTKNILSKIEGAWREFK